MKLAKMSQFIVEQEASRGGGRIGSFRFKATEDSVPYRTPLFFIHTLSGSVPHVTREVFDLIFPPASKCLPLPIQISIDSTFPFCDVLSNANRDISTFVGLGHCPSFLTVHNPLKELKSGFNDTRGISIWPRLGRRTLDDKKFAQIVTDFKPSSFQAMSDYDVNSLSTNKRFIKSSARTLRSLEECIKCRGSNSNSLFATLETGWWEVNEPGANRVLVDILENSNHITGFVLGGIGLPLSTVEVSKKSKNNRVEDEEKICPKVDRAEVLGKILPKLPKDKPIYVPGPLNPEEIIDLVAMGVDMFDSSIITRMADEGDVFLFELDEYIPEKEKLPLKTYNEGLAGADVSKPKLNSDVLSSVLKLKEKRYFDDFSPISPTCDCYACRRHTKAYINHLFTVKELLGPVLVMAHNLVTFNRFFEAIRHCIQKDSENGQLLKKLRNAVKVEVPEEASSDINAPVGITVGINLNL